LQGEVKKEDQWLEAEEKEGFNEELNVVERGLESCMLKGALKDVGLYLYGVVLKDL
jgi:hypothetical protein